MNYYIKNYINLYLFYETSITKSNIYNSQQKLFKSWRQTYIEI